VDGVLRFVATNGLTIEGNGATMKDLTPGVANNRVGPHPFILFAKDQNVSVSDLNFVGPYNGSNGGVAVENYIGLETVSSKNLTLTNVNVSNIQGDCLSVQFPSLAIGVSGGVLNQNINVTGSTFKNCGYTGLSVESVNGLNVTNSTFANVAENAIDFEYDVYSSIINSAGIATVAAQDNITIKNNTFNGWGIDWFASLQGQKPGVQQDNVVLEDNTLNAGRPLIQVKGTNSSSTTAPYLNNGLTIENNTNTAPAKSTTGGSPPGNFVGYAMTIQNVTDLTITGNNFPVWDDAAGFPNTPFVGALKPTNVNGYTVSSNQLHGAQGVIHGDSGTTGTIQQCLNTYSVNGAKTDAAACIPIEVTTTTTTTTTTTSSSTTTSTTS
jgi:hypothetical protein